MNKIFLVSLAASIFILSVPALSSAHMGGLNYDHYGMMGQIGNVSVLSDEAREEMESLMAKMMDGTLTESEKSRMYEFMEWCPMALGTATARVDRYGGGMMGMGNIFGYGNWWMGFWGVIIFLGVIIWLVVGALLVALLLKRIKGK